MLIVALLTVRYKTAIENVYVLRVFPKVFEELCKNKRSLETVRCIITAGIVVIIPIAAPQNEK